MIAQLIAPLLTLALGSSPGAGEAIVLQADVVHTAAGAVEKGRVLIRDGIIEAVGVDVGEGARVIEVEGHLSAGLVALGSTVSLGDEARDETRQVMDTADIAHGYDPNSKHWSAYHEAGVTAVLLTPERGSLVGGRTAVVKPGRKIAAKRAHLDICFSTEAFQNGIAPSSYPGAIAMLEEAMEGGRGGFGLLKDGLPAYLDARSRAEAGRAIAFAARHGLRGALNGVRRAGDLAEQLSKAGLGVILPPLGPGADPRALATPKQLAAKGVAFGFSVGGPKASPHSLRVSAAMAVRAGLDRQVAMASLTGSAGALSGAAVGSLEAGRAADLVLWSGDPLDLTSQVEHVWIDGETVYGGDDQ